MPPPDAEPGPVIVAIDGPAASGKSSVARRLAERTGFRHVNSGLMYRAATRAALDEGIDPDDPAAVAAYFDGAAVSCRETADGLEIRVGGRVRRGLSEDDVNDKVSAVARVPEVRAVMVALQRAMAAGRPTVMEGRDIGSVVFPEARFKFYIDASQEVRAARRAAQGSSEAIGDRDRLDSSRKESPLVVPGDAVVIDSSHLDVDGVVDRIVGALHAAGLPVGAPGRGGGGR
jgi:cytidylate kinase